MRLSLKLLIIICAGLTVVLTGCQKPSADTGLPLAPICKKYNAGYSVQKRPIDYFVLGSGTDVVFIMSAIHGNEPASATLVYATIDYLKKNPNLLKGRKVVIMPVANPDGLAANTRFNARNIDLNRNFEAINRLNKPQYGTTGLSEPESVIIKQVILKYKPNRIFSLHQPLACIDYDGPAGKIAQQLSRYCDLPVQKLGARPGSLGSYAGVTLSIPIITIELKKTDTNRSESQLWQDYGQMMLAAILYPQNP